VPLPDWPMPLSTPERVAAHFRRELLSESLKPKQLEATLQIITTPYPAIRPNELEANRGRD
jgi:hypothetical protein